MGNPRALAAAFCPASQPQPCLPFQNFPARAGILELRFPNGNLTAETLWTPPPRPTPKGGAQPSRPSGWGQKVRRPEVWLPYLGDGASHPASWAAAAGTEGRDFPQWPPSRRPTSGRSACTPPTGPRALGVKGELYVCPTPAQRTAARDDTAHCPGPAHRGAGSRRGAVQGQGNAPQQRHRQPVRARNTRVRELTLPGLGPTAPRSLLPSRAPKTRPPKTRPPSMMRV